MFETVVKIIGGAALGAIFDFGLQRYFGAKGDPASLLGTDAVERLQKKGIIPVRLTTLVESLSAQELAETVVGRSTVRSLFPFIIFVHAAKLEETKTVETTGSNPSEKIT